MSGEPPRDELDGEPTLPEIGDEDDARATIPQARMPYLREHSPASAPSGRRPTIPGSASSPPTSAQPTSAQPPRPAGYGAIPGPAPLPRVPGMDRMLGDDAAAGRAAVTGRHRSRRPLRAEEATPPPTPTLPGGSAPPPDVDRVPVSLSAPPPEVHDDDWGAPEAAAAAAPAAPPPRPSSPARAQSSPAIPIASPPRPSSPARAEATPPPSTQAVASDTESNPVSSRPVARITIPRPAPRPVSVPPAEPAAAATFSATPAAEPAAQDAIQPVRIIDVMSDLPPVEPSPPDEDEETGLPLRLLADGPTPIDARAYLQDLETEPPPPDDEQEALEGRGSFEEVEPEPLEEVESEARSEVEPDSFEEVEPEREPEPERMPDSTEEIEPDRDSDSGEEIPVDLAEEPVSAPRPPRPPPRRPPAMAAADLSAYTPPATPTAPTPEQAPAAPAAAPPPPPPPLKTQTKPGAEHTPVADTEIPRRKKPWWEELFSEDFIRTMDKVDAKTVRREVDFIEDRLGMEKGAVILDLACGPGMHAVEMASRGYSVVGYDLSLAMLARASDEAQDRQQKINFLHGDMREMAFEETFDAVYCWGTSFGFFDEEKNLDILARVNRGLRAGGMLLLDVINRDYVACRQPSLVWFEGEGCVCMDEMQVDFFTSRLKVKRTVMFEDGRSRELDYSIRLYGLHELGKLLHEAGFKVTEVTGHPAHPGVFFGSESPRLIILAERA